MLLNGSVETSNTLCLAPLTHVLSKVFAFLGILVMSMMVAFVASMAFEAPFMGLEKILVQGVKSAVKRVSSGDSQASAASGKDGYRKF